MSYLFLSFLIGHPVLRIRTFIVESVSIYSTVPGFAEYGSGICAGSEITDPMNNRFFLKIIIIWKN